MMKNDIEYIVRNIMNNSDIGKEELKKIIILQWNQDKKIHNLKLKVESLEKIWATK